MQNNSPTARIVTISNRYGCGGLAVAAAAAERLGYQLIDQQLPVVVAKRLGISEAAVESAEDIGKTVGERMLRGLELGTPELRGAESGGFDEELLHEIQQALRDYAAQGNVVIVGRGAHAILGRRDDLLRVFLHAPRDWRIRHTMREHGVDESTASAEVDRVDRARREYMRAYYAIEWDDPSNFDLVLDTASFGTEHSAAIIVTAVRWR